MTGISALTYWVVPISQRSSRGCDHDHIGTSCHTLVMTGNKPSGLILLVVHFVNTYQVISALLGDETTVVTGIF
jgi:hypothetical protein